MNKNMFICDLIIDQKIEEVPFALNEFEKKLSRQQKPYYNVELSDKTGKIRGKIWSESTEAIDTNAKVGDIVSVNGMIQEYAGKPQIIITSLKVLTDIAPEEFLPVTARDRNTMKEQMETEIKNIKDPYLSKLLNNFWEDENCRDRYLNYPAGEYVHHGYVGGLLEHTWEMLVLSKPYFKLYPEMNWDLYFTGLFFHDVGKIDELEIVGATIVRTTAGKLVAHIGQGLIIVDRLVSQIKDFPEETKNKLYHLILSHQGMLETGSPIVPQTLEALVLSLVDKSGADMNQAAKHIERNLETGEDFTDFHKWLKRSFYQRDILDQNNTLLDE